MTSRRHVERAAFHFGWVGQVVAWLVITSVVAMLAVVVVIPRLAGATPYTILTSSMEPTMPPGTLVVVKPVDVDQIAVGDVITYQLKSGEPAVATHRVKGVGLNAKGERLLTTQGDANESADAAPVRTVQVKGTRMYAIPHLGRVNNVLTAGQREIGVVIVAGLLLGYAGVMFFAAACGATTKSRRREQVA